MFDDVCTFDENGVCMRHGVKHEGRFHRLSQDKTSVGHQFRKIWDQQKTPPPADTKKGCGCSKPQGSLT